MKKRVVLAYSGGLDTTAIIPWLKENYDYEIIAVCIDVGQGIDELDKLEERGLESGAEKVYVLNVVDEFITDYVYPTLKAGAVYESEYLLGTSMARPLMSKLFVEIAHKEGAEAICHGATGKGNDQIRFELGIKALDPNLKIIAPWRIWDIQSREDAIEYCQSKGIYLPFNAEQSYSRDRNIWHISHEGLDIEHPENEIDYKKILTLTNTLEEAPNEAEYVEIHFDKGIPTKINGEEKSPTELLEFLNEIGGKHGVGVIDITENRVVGMKSRGIYETPGGTILYKAIEALEELVFDRDVVNFKQMASKRFADLCYEGKWFVPIREALSAFFDNLHEVTTGDVRVKLYKGNIVLAGVSSPNSLHNEEIASFTTGDLYDHKDAEGFINLFGLSLTVRALMKENNEKK